MISEKTGIMRKPQLFNITLLWATTCLLRGLLFVCLAVPLRVSLSHAEDLSHLSISELLEIDVTSVSKKPERASESAAALTVLTGEEIRRSGATTIWDALRLAPGVQVLKQLSLGPVVSIRGFNDLLNPLLLVLKDGRPLFNPFDSGYNWQMIDFVIEDVDRIEIIRGPGAALWGDNAVNGVVNIITKDSEDTQGLLVSGGTGTYERANGTVRYGGEIGESTTYRAWLKGTFRDEFESVDGEGIGDDWWFIRPGFRLDSALNDDDTFTLDAEFNRGGAGGPRLELDDVRQELGGDDIGGVGDRKLATSVNARLHRNLGQDSHALVQGWYEYSRFDLTLADLEWSRFSLRFEHRLPLNRYNDFLWGIEYRNTDDNFHESGLWSMEPDSANHDVFSGFIHDEIELLKDELRLALGVKLLENDFTGFEYQPQARVSWTPTRLTTLWGAVSRSVRTPGRGENDARLLISGLPASEETGGLPVAVTLFGNDEAKAITQLTYEVGLRSKLEDNLYFDIALFYSDYSDFFSAELGDPAISPDAPFPLLEIPATFRNELEYYSFGGEVSLDYRPIESVRLVATYALVKVGASASETTTDRCDGDLLSSPLFCLYEDSTPNNIVSLRSSVNLPKGFTADTFIQYVESFDAKTSPTMKIDQFVTLDVRLGWRASAELELAIVGQNLIEDGHAEWTQDAFSPETDLAEVPRGVYAQITYQP